MLVASSACGVTAAVPSISAAAIAGGGGMSGGGSSDTAPIAALAGVVVVDIIVVGLVVTRRGHESNETDEVAVEASGSVPPHTQATSTKRDSLC